MWEEYYQNLFIIVKTLVINFFTIITSSKIIKQRYFSNNGIKKLIYEIILIGIVSIIGIFIETKSDKFYYSVYTILSLTIVLCEIDKINFGYATIVNLISLGINYMLFFMALIISGIPNGFKLKNDTSNIIIILVIYIFIISIFISQKKFKNGFGFIQENIKNGNADNIILNISVVIIFFVTFLTNINITKLNNTFIAIILISIIMFITISKSFQLYYKHRLLMKELDRLNAELDESNRNYKELEKENIEINKINHTLSHKQKALEHKINKLLMNTEISNEITPIEMNEIKESLENISKEIHKEKVNVSLKKTEISNIDNMLELMQEECIKNKIEFELQIIGNIFYMTNHYISKEDLEILIADHVKDAIIAINHSDNEYRSILVRLGKIDNFYSLYIYDSGIEFEEETLANLGKRPCTTHAEDGGTGFGFMNTFDTLKKYSASLIIKELAKPSKANYTKIVIIKFDGENNFKIESYKQNVKN